MSLDLLYDWVCGPFVEFSFMRRALVGTLALALSSAPLGVFLTLRRMSLFGDALSHAVLPGVAIAFIYFGLSLTALSIGGLIAGMAVVTITGFVSRHTNLKEDASLTAGYLVALALGVMLIAGHGTQLDLLHILFGNVLAVDVEGLLLMASVATVSILALALLYRGLLLETFDPVFLAASAGKRSGRGAFYQQTFLMLVVLNLVAAFQTLGTLMAVGLMMLPAIAARVWHESLAGQLAASSLIAMLASAAGLLISYHLNLPSGPTIIVCAGVLYALSLVFAPRGWLSGRRRPHLQG